MNNVPLAPGGDSSPMYFVVDSVRVCKSDDIHLAAAPVDPLGKARRAQLMAYLRSVNGWIGRSGVAANNLTCRNTAECEHRAYIFVNGNLARGLMAGWTALRNQTQLDIGLSWCDTFVSSAMRTTASDGTEVLYWDSGYSAVFFGDSGTALQAVATGYRFAAAGSGGAALAAQRRAKYMRAMQGYYHYVAKGCTQPPQIKGFAYGNACPPPGQGWLITSGPTAGAIGDGFCPPKHTGGVCFAAYSCATGTTAAGAFGALAASLPEDHAERADLLKVVAAAGQFIASEIDQSTLTDYNYDNSTARANIGGAGWIPQHWMAYPFGEGLVQAALVAPPSQAAAWAKRTAPLAAYLCRAQHPSGYFGSNSSADMGDLRRGARVVTFLQWHYAHQPTEAVGRAISRFVDFLLARPSWLGVADDTPVVTPTGVGLGPGLVTGFVSLAAGDLLAFGSTFGQPATKLALKLDDTCKAADHPALTQCAKSLASGGVHKMLLSDTIQCPLPASNANTPCLDLTALSAPLVVAGLAPNAGLYRANYSSSILKVESETPLVIRGLTFTDAPWPTCFPKLQPPGRALAMITVSGSSSVLFENCSFVQPHKIGRKHQSSFVA